MVCRELTLLQYSNLWNIENIEKPYGTGTYQHRFMIFIEKHRSKKFFDNYQLKNNIIGKWSCWKQQEAEF